jgi:hypothetical protein
LKVIFLFILLQKFFQTDAFAAGFVDFLHFSTLKSTVPEGYIVNFTLKVMSGTDRKSIGKLPL